MPKMIKLLFIAIMLIPTFCTQAWANNVGMFFDDTNQQIYIFEGDQFKNIQNKIRNNETLISTDLTDTGIYSNHNRIITSKGDTIYVWTRESASAPASVNFEEKYRDSEFIRGVTTIIKTIIGTKALGVKYKLATTYTLKEDKAFLVVNFKGENDLVTNAPSFVKSITLITGDEEHFFWGVDTRVTYAEQIKYDNATATLQPKDTPNSFYVSLNYKIGDYYKTDNIWNNIVVKGLVRPSTNQDSFGIGLGYRGGKILWNIWDTNLCSPFVAVLWPTNDTTQGGVPKVNSVVGLPSVSIGLTFDINTLADWISGGGSK